MKKYEFLGSCTGKKFCIRGVNVYKYKWLMEGDCVIVTDPKTGKPRSFSAYKIQLGENELKFVAGPLGDGSTGFYAFPE